MRLFFALWPPRPLAEQLADIARSCAARFGGRPTRAETIHLTTAFLGEVAEARLPKLVKAAEEVRGAPFTLTLDRLGYWGHNRLLWAGSTDAAVPAALGETVAGLHRALRQAGFAVADEDRLFAPHLTLVRKLRKAPERLALPAIAPLDWPCSSLVLVSSQLSSVGSAYQIVGEFPFGAGLP